MTFLSTLCPVRTCWQFLNSQLLFLSLLIFCLPFWLIKRYFLAKFFFAQTKIFCLKFSKHFFVCGNNFNKGVVHIVVCGHFVAIFLFCLNCCKLNKVYNYAEKLRATFRKLCAFYTNIIQKYQGIYIVINYKWDNSSLKT